MDHVGRNLGEAYHLDWKPVVSMRSDSLPYTAGDLSRKSDSTVVSVVQAFLLITPT